MGIGLPELLILCAIVVVITGLVLLYRYIYQDARRRNMNAALWTVLAVVAPSGIGILLYFILRDPLPAYCWKCGAAVQPGFAYCPQCGTAMTNACPQCHRVPQPGWTHCAACGVKL